MKGIYDAKAEIINNIQKDGTIILNKDDKFLKFEEESKNEKAKVISWEWIKADVHLVKILKKGEIP